jgi:hypothetical protein
MSDQHLTKLEHELRKLRDRLEIIEITHLYSTALDTRDWRLLERVFLPDSVADYGKIAGVRHGLAEITALVKRVLEPLDASQHLIGNHIIELDGDTARCSSYLQAQHTRRGCEGGDNYVIGGGYRDELVRTPGGWRIRHRTLEAAWSEGNSRVVMGG